MPQLHPKHGALNTFKPVVVALENMLVFPLRAPVAKHAYPARIVIIVRRHHAAFSVGAQVLPGIKAEAPHVAETADPLSVVLRTMRLSSVFYDDKTFPAAQYPRIGNMSAG